MHVEAVGEAFRVLLDGRARAARGRRPRRDPLDDGRRNRAAQALPRPSRVAAAPKVVHGPMAEKVEEEQQRTFVSPPFLDHTRGLLEGLLVVHARVAAKEGAVARGAPIDAPSVEGTTRILRRVRREGRRGGAAVRTEEHRANTDRARGVEDGGVRPREQRARVEGCVRFEGRQRRVLHHVDAARGVPQRGDRVGVQRLGHAAPMIEDHHERHRALYPLTTVKSRNETTNTSPVRSGGLAKKKTCKEKGEHAAIADRSLP